VKFSAADKANRIRLRKHWGLPVKHVCLASDEAALHYTTIPGGLRGVQNPP